jgi:hypothetical protein
VKKAGKCVKAKNELRANQTEKQPHVIKVQTKNKKS